MRILFIFLDGVGLGLDDARINPFARADTPTIRTLLGGHSLTAETAPYEGELASLLALDACLGVPGLPQSATGQATLLTGINVPSALGYHYGPKPNPAVAEFLRNGNLFARLQQKGKRAALLNAYPPRYFAAIHSGRRIYSAIPQAVVHSGLELMNADDLNRGHALSADFTGQGWVEHLGLPGTPLLTPYQAGERMAALSRKYEFSLFEYWLSDYAGHRQDMAEACRLLERFDQVLAGLVFAWDCQEGLILMTSDHGNLEDLSTRRHTRNPVPALCISTPGLRSQFCAAMKDLSDIPIAIQRYLSMP